MDPEKFAEIQVQMKRNQEDYGDFLRDLDDWSQNIKKTDDELKCQSLEEKQSLPPVRNSLLKKKKKKVRKPQQPAENGDKVTLTANQKQKGISGYDFRAWDKYDVNKALEEVDGRQASSSSSSSDIETDEEWEEERAKQMANVFKDQGNQYFKEGKYDEAVEVYTKGIMTDSNNAILPANRAMALLKQAKYAAAEMDCSQAIMLDPTYVKAYARRGSARCAMGKLEVAKKDFERVLKLEPGNKQAKLEIENIDKKLNSALEVTEDSGIVTPIYKPPEKRSKKPLKRLIIEEIGEDPEERKKAIAETVSNQSEMKKKIVQQEEEMFQQFTKVDMKESDKTKTPNSCNEDLKLYLLPESTTVTTSSSLSGSSSVSTPTSSSPSSKCSIRTPSSSNSSPNSSPRIPAVPLNSFQFQKDWQLLKPHPDKFYQYFKVISPNQYPKLFGQALETDMLMMVLRILMQYYVSKESDIYEILLNLVKVKRFSMTVMFLSEEDKKVVRDLFTILENTSHHSTADIEKLMKSYEV